jgi:chaperonin GroES
MSKEKQTETFQLAKPLADRVLIKTESVAEKTAGGIIIPETAESRDTKIGTVVSVGEGIYTNDGVRIPMTVQVGDRVMMPFAGSAQKVKLGDEDFLLFREQELLMIIK